MGEFPNKETQFQPGESGNINGRPKGKSISTILKEMLEKNVPASVKKIEDFLEYTEGRDLTHAELVALKLMIGIEKNNLSNQQLNAIDQVMDRTEGKPLQKSDFTTNGESLKNEIDYSKLSIEALREIANLKQNENKTP